MSQLERLAYVSRATVPMDALLNIAEILAASQRNNWRDGITGALAYADGEFLQVVEGPQEAVNRLLARVSADARHEDLKVVSREIAAQRQFPDWSMAMPRLSPDSEPLMRAAVQVARSDPGKAVADLRRLTEIDALHA
ncbi:BLUF domain-containing protein [Brevundimonas sp.]|jgi:hypothetical protein|uniref:BLUF domain-containing protein n=1 Tax=Brevundimonas sp. TaxID=1871086 RepID=UPI002E16456B|nr:BLUF domain-containing protein [Brevundimonas sp.]